MEENKTAEETTTSTLLTVFEIVKKDFDKEVRKIDYSTEGQIAVNNFYNALNKIIAKLTQQQSANAELKKQKEELVELIKIAQNNIPVGGSKQSQERYLNFMERSTEILKQIENTQPKN